MESFIQRFQNSEAKPEILLNYEEMCFKLKFELLKTIENKHYVFLQNKIK